MEGESLSMSWLWGDGKWVPFGFTQVQGFSLPHRTTSLGLQNHDPHQSWDGAHACGTGVPTGAVHMKSESWGPSVLSYLFQELNSRLSEGFISLM